MWCVICIGGQLGRIPSTSYSEHWLYGMYMYRLRGDNYREDPKYPGILSILDTGYMVCMCRGKTWEDPKYS